MARGTERYEAPEVYLASYAGTQMEVHPSQVRCDGSKHDILTHSYKCEHASQLMVIAPIRLPAFRK